MKGIILKIGKLNIYFLKYNYEKRKLYFLKKIILRFLKE